MSIVFTVLALLRPASAQTSTEQHLLVRVDRTVPVLTRPHGSRLAMVGRTTAFGSVRVLSVIKRSGRWLKVTTADLPAARNGWVDGSRPGLVVQSTSVSIVIHLSRRTLELRLGNHVVSTIDVGVGAPGTPTPVGRFAVTDKMPGSWFDPAYGCCVLALSARQTHLPTGWHGGDRIAIHGTNMPSSIGAAVSTGCVHAANADVRYLMTRVPLGTPVTIEL